MAGSILIATASAEAIALNIAMRCLPVDLSRFDVGWLRWVKAERGARWREGWRRGLAMVVVCCQGWFLQTH